MKFAKTPKMPFFVVLVFLVFTVLSSSAIFAQDVQPQDGGNGTGFNVIMIKLPAVTQEPVKHLSLWEKISFESTYDFVSLPGSFTGLEKHPDQFRGSGETFGVCSNITKTTSLCVEVFRAKIPLSF